MDTIDESEVFQLNEDETNHGTSERIATNVSLSFHSDGCQFAGDTLKAGAHAMCADGEKGTRG